LLRKRHHRSEHRIMVRGVKTCAGTNGALTDALYRPEIQARFRSIEARPAVCVGRGRPESDALQRRGAGRSAILAAGSDLDTLAVNAAPDSGGDGDASDCTLSITERFATSRQVRKVA
jgi:hypothetical protein